MKIGSMLRRAREIEELSQAEVAKHAQMQQTCYSRIERDLQEPNLDQLKAICEILKLDANTLLGIDVQENKDLLFAQKVKIIYDQIYKGK